MLGPVPLCKEEPESVSKLIPVSSPEKETLPVPNLETQPAHKMGPAPVSELGLGYKLEPKAAFRLGEVTICTLYILPIYNSVSVTVCKLEPVPVCI